MRLLGTGSCFLPATPSKLKHLKSSILCVPVSLRCGLQRRGHGKGGRRGTRGREKIPAGTPAGRPSVMSGHLQNLLGLSSCIALPTSAPRLPPSRPGPPTTHALPTYSPPRAPSPLPASRHPSFTHAHVCTLLFILPLRTETARPQGRQLLFSHRSHSAMATAFRRRLPGEQYARAAPGHLIKT